MTEVWTPLRLLEWTTRRFADAAIDSPRLAAQILLAHALGIDRVQLYVQHDRPLGPEELGRYRELVKRRLAGEPVAYLTGRQEFWSLPLAVDPRVLVPRRDTETLVEVVLDRVDRTAPLAIADIGTGSGAVALALARELPRAQVVATDRSAEALAVAQGNAERLGLADRIELRHGDLYGPLGEERFDVIASNPPYVSSGELAGLAPEVRREPQGALDGGADGLDVLRRLAAGAADHLSPGGLVAFEHGFDQGAAVRALIDATGAFAPAETRADMAGQPRVTWARILPRG
ncbi:MAG TPA: peptide chain release factor N(5)-glutamine methyltransferase [Kofleriaceae bacterium]|nr:peptide chain release factor N(5)-glutamine methyltransferase [Kofleriaceae bacterium]